MNNIFISELENKITIPDEHWYKSTKSERYLPSVTTILDAYPKGFAYKLWLQQVGMNANKILEEAGQVGSNVHSAIDMWVKLGKGKLRFMTDEKQNYTVEEWKLICKAMRFFELIKPEIIVHEFSFASDELGYGGTIDMICRINNVVWLIDYKSSNQVYDSHYLQIAAYAIAWNSLNPNIKIEKTGILHLKAATRTEKEMQGIGWKIEESGNSIEQDFEDFKHTQKMWLRANKGAKPFIQEYPLVF